MSSENGSRSVTSNLFSLNFKFEKTKFNNRRFSSKLELKSLPNQFLQMLMKAPSNSYLTVPGRSPADLINRCNLGKGGLKELFFGKYTKAQAFFKGLKVEKQIIK